MGFLRRFKIFTQLSIAFTCLVIIMLIIIYSMYIQTSNILIKNNDKYSEDAINKYEKEILQNYDEIKQIILTLSFDPYVQKFFVQTDTKAIYEMIKDMDRKMISISSSRKGIEDIIIIGKNGARYSLNGGIENLHKSENEILNNNSVFVSSVEDYIFNKNKINCVLFASNVLSSNITNVPVGMKIGYISVVINLESLIFENEASSKTGIKYYYIDSKNEIYPQKNEDNLDKIVEQVNSLGGNAKIKGNLGGENGIIHAKKISELEGTILTFVPEESLLSELMKVRTKTLSIFFLALLFMSIPLIMIVNNILHPIQQLVKFMNSIKRGNLKNLKTKLELNGNVEMKAVGEELNGMLAEINILTQRLVETTTNLLEAEIENEKAASAYLRSQINPHFLYNTLESIKGVAMEEGVNKIVQMTTALGKLFHYSIKGEGYVTVEVELVAVKSYIFLQLIRFEGRFEVVYNFPEEVLKIKIMKMILQPIIENAIYHGLEPKMTKGLLKIEGEKLNDSTLIIRIIDDGAGIEEGKLREINNKITNKTTILSKSKNYTFESTNIGILNVNNRLKLAYGPGYGLSIESEIGKGTCMILKIPIDKIDEKGD